MDTGRVYYDQEGNPRTIHQMVKYEPAWAASRIQAGEDAAAEVKRLRDAIESILVTAAEGCEFMTRVEMAKSIQKEALAALGKT